MLYILLGLLLTILGGSVMSNEMVSAKKVVTDSCNSLLSAWDKLGDFNDPELSRAFCKAVDRLLDLQLELIKRLYD